MHCFFFFTRSSSNRWGLFEIDHIKEWSRLCNESELFLHIGLLSREQSPVTVIISTEQKIMPPLPDLFFPVSFNSYQKTTAWLSGRSPKLCALGHKAMAYRSKWTVTTFFQHYFCLIFWSQMSSIPEPGTSQWQFYRLNRPQSVNIWLVLWWQLLL